MSYWLREIAGWLLVGLGLFTAWIVYEFARRRMILEVWPVTIFGIFIFRGGIHMLKVAVAARICRESNNRLYPAAPPSVKDKIAVRPSAPRRDKQQIQK